MIPKQDILKYIGEHKDDFNTPKPNWKKIYGDIPSVFGWETGQVTDFLHFLHIRPENGFEDYIPYCFYGCSIIEVFNKEGRKYTLLEHSAFIEAIHLTEVHLPEGLKEIGPQCFCGCASLRNIDIPKSVTFIGDNAFAHCLKLEEIIIPNIKSIENGLLTDCSSLKTVRLPKTITDIYSNAFGACNNLENIFYEGTIEEFKKVNIEEDAFYGVPAPGIICSNGVFYLE